jgi:acylphosphatase
MTAVETARRLGLRGWVRNLRDGSVEVVAEGAEQTVRDFEAWCRRGPELAQVRELRAEYGPASGEFSAFETRG